jgi:hypothetical protein
VSVWRRLDAYWMEFEVFYGFRSPDMLTTPNYIHDIHLTFTSGHTQMHSMAWHSIGHERRIHLSTFTTSHYIIFTPRQISSRHAPPRFGYSSLAKRLGAPVIAPSSTITNSSLSSARELTRKLKGLSFQGMEHILVLNTRRFF